MQQLFGGFHDLRRLAHAARPGVAAGKKAAFRTDKVDAAGLQGAQIGLCCLGRPHARVHGRSQQNGRFGGQQGGGEHIVSDPTGQLGHQIGRGRSHQKQVGLLGQRNMLHIPAFGAGEGIHTDGTLAEGLKGQRGHQPGGVFRHNDVHLMAQLFQPGNDLAGFIGRNAARHAHDDLHGITPVPPGRARR